jgi:hypothetical protein
MIPRLAPSALNDSLAFANTCNAIARRDPVSSGLASALRLVRSSVVEVTMR